MARKTSCGKRRGRRVYSDALKAEAVQMMLDTGGNIDPAVAAGLLVRSPLSA